MAEVSSRNRSIAKLGALVLLIAGGILAAQLTPLGGYLSREGIGDGIEFLRNSSLAPVIFIALYAGATALAIPGTILTLAGGAVFGVFWGVIFNSIAANIGANAAFLIARGLGREGVRGLMGDDSDALKKMDAVVGKHGFQGLLTLRLIPLVPFNALNFGSGLMPLKWSTYAFATVVGIFPGTVVYTFFADALLQGSQEASREALIRAVIAGALLVLLSFLPQILKRFNISLPGAPAAVLALGLLWSPTAVAAQDNAAEIGLPGHAEFSEILNRVVEGPLVDYRALKGLAPNLGRYLETLNHTSEDALAQAPHGERLAFWINAYNACMLNRVVEHYPIQRAGGLRRIKNAVASRPANSVWQISDVFSDPHCNVAGRARSQDEIEHQIIRPMGDPRIHFAVNCAAQSCPPLASEAYTGARLDEQLDNQVRAFMSAPAHFAWRGSTVTLNKVLDWFGDDFGGPDGVKSFFANYAEGEVRSALENPETTVEFFDYDWTLNDLPR